MRIRINKSIACGTVKAPPSKSMAHRLLIAAAMCRGESVIRGISYCEDALATVDCLRALGAEISITGDTARVRGVDMKAAQASDELFCRESGSTLRFLLPIALLSGNTARLTGAKRLIERPHGVYEDICREKGLLFENDGAGITVKGRLTAGCYSIPGNVSSQFITGLLFALAATGEESRIRITTGIESRSYIELTRAALSTFGVSVRWEDGQTLFIEGNQTLKPTVATVEGDYSGAVFTDCFNYLGGKVKLTGLNRESLQGDRVYKELLPRLAGGFSEINIEDCPDLGPVLFAFAAAKHGGRFYGTARLRIKESDRAAVMAKELLKLGVELTVEENTVTVPPCTLHAPNEPLYGHNDHRIVMALSMLLTLLGGELDGAEAIRKSYPEYIEDIRKLGIEVFTYEA